MMQGHSREGSNGSSKRTFSFSHSGDRVRRLSRHELLFPLGLLRPAPASVRHRHERLLDHPPPAEQRRHVPFVLHGFANRPAPDKPNPFPGGSASHLLRHDLAAGILPLVEPAPSGGCRYPRGRRHYLLLHMLSPSEALAKASTALSQAPPPLSSLSRCFSLSKTAPCSFPSHCLPS